MFTKEEDVKEKAGHDLISTWILKILCGKFGKIHFHSFYIEFTILWKKIII